MNINIRMATKRDSRALRQFAEHALKHKMGSRAEGIRCARIRLQDVNGPRGGVDKICRIRLEVAGRGDVSVSGEATGWYEAVTIAVINARTALDRRIGRVRDRKPRQRREGYIDSIPSEDANGGVA